MTTSLKSSLIGSPVARAHTCQNTGGQPINVSEGTKFVEQVAVRVVTSPDVLLHPCLLSAPCNLHHFYRYQNTES